MQNQVFKFHKIDIIQLKFSLKNLFDGLWLSYNRALNTGVSTNHTVEILWCEYGRARHFYMAQVVF